MTSEQQQPPSQYGNLLDFVYHVEGSDPLYVEVGVKQDGKVAVFHNKPFKRDLSWIEYDIGRNRIDFVMDDGDIRDVGVPVNKDVAKYMHNTHQVLMVLLDDETGEAKEGYYIPLIIHHEYK
ncbi:MAG: hypothetical protein ACK4VI_01400 [Alphaproteobacteria bacterium]